MFIYITVYYFSQFATSRHRKILASSNLNLIQKLYIYICISFYLLMDFILFIKVVFHA